MIGEELWLLLPEVGDHGPGVPFHAWLCILQPQPDGEDEGGVQFWLRGHAPRGGVRPAGRVSGSPSSCAPVLITDTWGLVQAPLEPPVRRPLGRGQPRRRRRTAGAMPLRRLRRLRLLILRLSRRLWRRLLWQWRLLLLWWRRLCSLPISMTLHMVRSWRLLIHGLVLPTRGLGLLPLLLLLLASGPMLRTPCWALQTGGLVLLLLLLLLLLRRRRRLMLPRHRRLG